MKFSVIIPTCNRPEMLGKCLDRLKPGAQTMDSIHYEVIVTDDSSNGETEAFISEHYDWVIYTNGPRKGPAANRNNGAGLAKGEWLLFTDDDCLPELNWMEEYEKAIQEFPECRAFEGAILPDDWDLLKKDMAECPVNDKGGCFWSANIAVKTVLFKQIGGFDEHFKLAANEDQDLKFKVSKITCIAFLQNAQVVHPVRIRGLVKKIKMLPGYEKSQILLMQNSGSSLFENYLDGIRIHLLAFFNSLKRLKIKSSIYSVVGFIYRISGIPFLLK